LSTESQRTLIFSGNDDSQIAANAPIAAIATNGNNTAPTTPPTTPTVRGISTSIRPFILNNDGTNVALMEQFLDFSDYGILINLSIQTFSSYELMALQQLLQLQRLCFFLQHALVVRSFSWLRPVQTSLNPYSMIVLNPRRKQQAREPYCRGSYFPPKDKDELG